MIVATFLFNAKNQSMIMIGIVSYFVVAFLMLMRKFAEKIVIDSKAVQIHTYNLFGSSVISIPVDQAEFELYSNMLSSKSKAGILFYQKSMFKFYLTLNQPGWTPELIEEARTALSQSSIKEKKNTK
jgi:hypothetical protein